MHWLCLLLLLAGVAVAVPALEEPLEPAADPGTETTASASPPSARFPSDANGHFRVPAVVGGREIEMLADTGASAIVLTEADARRAGFTPSSLAYDVPVATANGTAYAARVTLPRIEVAHIVRRDVPAFVAKPEALDRSLLGTTFLKRLREVTVTDGTLVLVD